MVFSARVCAMWGGALGFSAQPCVGRSGHPTVTLCRLKEGRKGGQNVHIAYPLYWAHMFEEKRRIRSCHPHRIHRFPQTRTGPGATWIPPRAQRRSFSRINHLITWPIQEKSARDPWRREAQIPYICDKSVIPNAAYSPRSPRWREFSGCSIHCPPAGVDGKQARGSGQPRSRTAPCKQMGADDLLLKTKED